MWSGGFFLVLLAAVAYLRASGVQANYSEFIALWAVLLLVAPFFMSRNPRLPDPKQLFPKYTGTSGFVYTILLQLATSIVAFLILTWAANTFLG